MAEKLPASEYTARFFIYFISRLLIYGVVAFIVVLAFFAGLNFMNINVLLKDGMYERAAVVIQGDDGAGLSKVFTEQYLQSDELLRSDAYDDYVVRSFNHSAKTDFTLVFPWQTEVTVTMTERIPYINGELPAELVTADTPESALVPPEWQDAKYRVTLKRSGGSFVVTDMEVAELLPKTDVQAATP